MIKRTGSYMRAETRMAGCSFDERYSLLEQITPGLCCNVGGERAIEINCHERFSSSVLGLSIGH